MLTVGDIRKAIEGLDDAVPVDTNVSGVILETVDVDDSADEGKVLTIYVQADDDDDDLDCDD